MAASTGARLQRKAARTAVSAAPDPSIRRCYGIQFGDAIQHRSGPTARYRLHRFDRACLEHRIEHRFSKPNHPWTNGQVERTNRTLKEATVRRYDYATDQQLQEHLAAFLDAYNFAKRLKSLNGLTP